MGAGNSKEVYLMYQANENRYGQMKYFHCGSSGLKLPAVSLGLWHNFGSRDNFDNMKAMCYTAFDQLPGNAAGII